MLNRLYQAAAATLMIALAPLASAGAPVDKATAERISAALNNPGMGLVVGSVSTSDIDGMYEVQFDNGPLVYATADGKHFVLGDLYQVDNGQLVNLTEKRRDAERVSQMAELDESQMIVFAPEGEVKGEITVFTDTTCFYCQKLHKEVPELNKNGVRVRYLAFPRGGADSAGYRQLVGAWCAENPQQTLTALKNKEPVPVQQCDPNPIDEQYRLGQQMGVRGTPAIITGSGQMIPGYQSADKLLATLGIE